MISKKWAKAALIRCIKTMAQGAISIIGCSVALSEVDWLFVASATLLAGLLSLLTSLAGLPEVQEDNDERKAEDN